MDPQQLRNILESCLLVAGKAMSMAQLETLFEEDIDRPERSEIKQSLADLQTEYEGRGIELVEVASGWRLQSSKSMEHWVGRLFQEKQPRYSRALLETLVLIAYRQPITRGEIEDVRGVAVSSNIIRTLQEREWIKEMGYKDVPGKPALWGTTKEFLDYFNIKRLDELPSLAEARDLAEIDAALAAEVGLVDGVSDGIAANDAEGDGDVDDGSEGREGSAGSDTSEIVTGEMDSAEFDENGESEASASESDVVADKQEQDSDENSAETDEGEPAEEEFLDSAPSDVAEAKLSDLAANIGKPREPEPGLGELADNFGKVKEKSDEHPVHHAAVNTTDALTDTPNDSNAADLHETDNLISESADDNLHESDESPDTDLSNDHDINDHDSTDQPDNVRPNDSSPVEAMEISAHDMDIEEWKDHATDRQKDHDTESNQPKAQADLRRVIDDFAEEHQKQLDADSDLQPTRHSYQSRASQSSSDTIQEQPVTTDGDENSASRSQRFSVRGTVEFESQQYNGGEPENQEKPAADSDIPGKHYKSAKGEP